MSEQQYQIVPQKNVSMSWGKWQDLFRSLPFNEMVKFTDVDKQVLEKQQASLLACFRRKRQKGYKITTRIIRADNTFVLCVWKIKVKEKKQWLRKLSVLKALKW